MIPFLFLPARVNIGAECVSGCSWWVDPAWVALYGFAWVGVAATVYVAWRVLRGR